MDAVLPVLAADAGRNHGVSTFSTGVMAGSR